MEDKKRKKDAYNTSKIPGYPGYRTRPGRSGNDPVDSALEQGHMMGLFLRKAITGRLRTRNPVYLTAMFFFGVLPFVLMLIGLWNVLINRSNPPGNTPSDFLFIVLPLLFLTGIIAYNFAISILTITGLLSLLNKRNTQSIKATKKRETR